MTVSGSVTSTGPMTNAGPTTTAHDDETDNDEDGGRIMALTPEEQRCLRRMERELQAADPELDERMRHPLRRWWIHWVIGLLLLIMAMAIAASPAPSGTGNNGGFFTISVVAFAAGWFFGRARRIVHVNGGGD